MKADLARQDFGIRRLQEDVVESVPEPVDIVLAMTNGQWDTEVLANLMFDWMFRGGGDFGRGATIAVVIMIAVIPIMIWNIRRANAEMENR